MPPKKILPEPEERKTCLKKPKSEPVSGPLQEQHEFFTFDIQLNLYEHFGGSGLMKNAHNLKTETNLMIKKSELRQFCLDLKDLEIGAVDELNSWARSWVGMPQTASLVVPCYVIDFPLQGCSDMNCFFFMKDNLGEYEEEFHPFAYQSWREANTIAKVLNQESKETLKEKKLGYAQVLTVTIEHKKKQKMKRIEKSEQGIRRESEKILQKI